MLALWWYFAEVARGKSEWDFGRARARCSVACCPWHVLWVRGIATARH